MNDDDNIKDFMEGKIDFGKVPAEYPLTDEQRKLAAFSMGINGAIVQFITEGLIPAEQQLHFVGHLQDFINRLYNGESLSFPGVTQTLQVNSKAGNMFYEAAESALKEGTDTFNKITEFTKKVNDFQREQQTNNVDPGEGVIQLTDQSKPTLH